MTSPLAEPVAWDLVSAGYTEHLPLVMQRFADRAIEALGLAPSAKVLDVACGPGTFAIAAAPKVAAVHAVDFSAPMIERLRERSRELANVTSEIADGQALPLSDRSFDAAVSLFGLMFFPDRGRGFAELRRVLRPGGIALVSSWAPWHRSDTIRLIFGALEAADPNRPPPPKNPLSLDDPELLRAEMSAADFDDVRIEEVACAVVATDPAEFWRVMIESSAPLVLLKRSMPADRWAEHETRAIAYLERELAPLPRSLSAVAWFATGRA